MIEPIQRKSGLISHLSVWFDFGIGWFGPANWTVLDWTRPGLLLPNYQKNVYGLRGYGSCKLPPSDSMESQRFISVTFALPKASFTREGVDGKLSSDHLHGADLPKIFVPCLLIVMAGPA